MIVIAPAPLVISIPSPAVSVAASNTPEDVSPISSCPSVGAEPA